MTYVSCQDCGAEIPFEVPEGGKWWNREQCRDCYGSSTQAPVPSPPEEESPDLSQLREFGVPSRIRREAGTHRVRILRSLEGTVQPGDSLFLTGPTGTGKSVTAAVLLWEYARAATEREDGGRIGWTGSFLFVTVPQWLSLLRGSFGTGETAGILERTRGARVLVLDDIGAERPTDWTLGELTLLVDHRYSEELPTILTSNLSLPELSDRLGDDRIPSRISGWCRAVKLEGRDLRTPPDSS